MMQAERDGVAGVLAALRFAARKHRDQRRKGAEGVPYVNHLIEVAELLARVGGVTDLATLQAAVLHDVLEDTDATARELEQRFGPEVRRLVEEMTDDKSLPWQQRKDLQVRHAPGLSRAAQQIKIADKICNLHDLVRHPPEWDVGRKQRYLDWADRVVAGCRGCNRALEELYAATSRRGRAALGMPAPE